MQHLHCSDYYIRWYLETRKLSYRKDDRAMRYYMGALKISESP